MTAMPEFEYQELLPTGHDDTPYRLLTTDGVSTFDTPEGRFVKVDPEALTLLTREAMGHRPSPAARPPAAVAQHPRRSRGLTERPLRGARPAQNAGIAAGGVLPMCQDTGTAIVKGKRGQFVFTGGGDEAAIAWHLRHVPHLSISATRRWRR